MVIWGNKMDELIIRKAVETDIDEVEKIYNAVLDKEKDSGKVHQLAKRSVPNKKRRCESI